MKVIKLPIYYKNNKKTKECRLSLIDNEELCVIEISLGSQSAKYEAESFFQALIELRLDLENDGGIIQCNGSDRQIFPSPLQMAMGGEKAYLLEIGKQARIQNVYDIFEMNKPDLDCVTVLEQEEFYNQWFNSLGGQ
ncbi:TPA: hypothetical protein U1B40_000871 [Streptococcus suis]|uniref:hypothetical protein n=1 Tax=Streptococcus suis TaxID=1307 RepID=UPI00195F7DAE|nr:hypothetical protein [Streptococcus suis]MBM7137289.1 hypothetical protein [Streptococcus suis]MBY4600343.1 hypothetical protein [Streptococcus suis]MCO8171884.1 hypothetical protein [Streptococcus suis]MCO8180556.1 hypothetical protein [Streptococcus suis]MCO8192527.1 hypothetical protein [Streptococcus suis]